MKSIVLFFLFSLLLGAADIDTKLYEGNNTKAYYEEVSLRIDQEVPQDQADIERIATERMILEKLQSMLSFTSKVDPMPNALLGDEGNITTENYLSYLNALADVYTAIDILKEEQSMMQSKRKFLRKSIQEITTEDKENLLLYQLQYAFYKMKGNHHTQSIEMYESVLKEGKERFGQALKRVSFNIPALEKALTATDSRFPVIEQEAVALNLAKEREEIHHENVSEVLNKKITANTVDMMDARTTKIDQKILLSLAYLQQGKIAKTLDFINSTTEIIDTLADDLTKHYTYKQSIIKDLFKEKEGNVALALSDVEQSAESLYDYTYKKFTEPLFVFNEHSISVLDILKVLLILVLGFMLAAFYKRKIMNLAQKNKLSYASAKMISGFGYYFIALITLLVALKSIGLDFSNLGLIAGALSIGIGFGLQTLVSNLAAGIILMFERTIRLGDYIEISDTIRGTVNDMKMRSTTVTTNDNIDVIIPNSSFIQNNVINWTLENDIRRIHIPFSVAYGTPNEKVEEVILEELKHSGINYVSIPPNYTTAIWMTAMGSSSVDYELIVWVRGNSTLRPAGTKSDFLKFIYSTLNKHHIEIPFPQLDLHVKEAGPKKEESDPESTTVQNEKPL
ncbi:MAG TPA: mechanosensitive ion channel domain-containing protein [Sulfurovum sp.]|uniref:mechanosensitive ion channel family protein n=1 Tax=Sulfurovum sp. TaxID=1969726 RepID=UPI002F92F970